MGTQPRPALACAYYTDPVADSVQAVYFDGTRATALLGSRVVRMGDVPEEGTDVLEDGTTVIEVGVEGIVVQTSDEATEAEQSH